MEMVATSELLTKMFEAWILQFMNESTHASYSAPVQIDTDDDDWLTSTTKILGTSSASKLKCFMVLGTIDIRQLN